MAQWTEDRTEIAHVAKINKEVLEAGALVEIRLKNGLNYQGRLVGMNIGNNAREVIPPNAMYSNIRIEQVDRSLVDIDARDVLFARSAWDRLKDDFERRGIIEIVDLPN